MRDRGRWIRAPQKAPKSLVAGEGVVILMYRPKIEALRDEAVKSLQQEKLQKQLAYVMATSAFYRRKFDEAGISVGHAGEPFEFYRIPFTEKDELRRSQVESPPLGDYQAAPSLDVIRVHSSSGTTGRPSYVGLTRKDAEMWTELAARAIYATGVRREHRVVLGFNLSFFSGGMATAYAIQAIGATLIPVGTGASERAMASLVDLKANYLAATPSYLRYLAEYLTKRGIDAAALGVEGIHVGGEPGGGIPHLRQQMENTWASPVREAMGNADMAPLIFAECGWGQGMHFIAPDYVLPEVIDPDTLEPLPLETGVKGELLYTSLERDCSPLVRFRTHDYVSVTSEPCDCGRTGFRIRCIGRTDDMLIVLGVNVFPSAVRDVVAGLWPKTSGEILIEVPDDGPRVEPPLKIKVERGPKNSDPELLRHEVEQVIRQKLIVPSRVEVVAAGALQRHEGKTPLVRRLPKSGT